MEIERSDVNIEKLFRWGSSVDLMDEYGNKKLSVYVRLVGDAELNRARVSAIRRSAEFRNKLKDPKSEERFVFIDNVIAVIDDRDEFINKILLLEIRPITQRVIREVDVPLPREPKSDALLEEQEEYQKKVDEYPSTKNTLIRTRVTDAVEKDRIELEKKDIPFLKKVYEDLIISELCEQEMVKRFRDYCVYFATFEDESCSKKIFNDFEEYDNLPSHLKEQLLVTYSGLEINVDELKKLQEAAQ